MEQQKGSYESSACFSCCVFICMPDQQRRKWDPTNRKLVHIGYIGEFRTYCDDINIQEMSYFFKIKNQIQKKRNHLHRQQN